MSEQTSGLRFDVYERVHLPDDVAAIDELEEIELVPRIQVIDQGDHAVLKGQLLLSGVYRGQNAEEAPLVLEHWIPVEITLPMNRISR
ncbi:peptidoglycan-binding protein, partial [Paenibacillus sp. MCAF20]